MFGGNSNILFAEKSVIVCGNLYQLTTVWAKPVHSLDDKN